VARAARSHHVGERGEHAKVQRDVDARRSRGEDVDALVKRERHCEIKQSAIVRVGKLGHCHVVD